MNTKTTNYPSSAFNCNNNLTCQILTSVAGGAAGGLVGWKVGDLVDNSLLQNVKTLTETISNTLDDSIKQMNGDVGVLNKILSKITEEQATISPIIGSITNVTSVIESEDYEKNEDINQKKVEKVDFSIKGLNVYVN